MGSQGSCSRLFAPYIASCNADLEYLKECNAEVNGQDMVDVLLALVAHQLKVISVYAIG